MTKEEGYGGRTVREDTNTLFEARKSIDGPAEAVPVNLYRRHCHLRDDQWWINLGRSREFWQSTDRMAPGVSGTAERDPVA